MEPRSNGAKIQRSKESANALDQGAFALSMAKPWIAIAAGQIGAAHAKGEGFHLFVFEAVPLCQARLAIVALVNLDISPECAGVDAHID